MPGSRVSREPSANLSCRYSASALLSLLIRTSPPHSLPTSSHEGGLNGSKVAMLFEYGRHVSPPLRVSSSRHRPRVASAPSVNSCSVRSHGRVRHSAVTLTLDGSRSSFIAAFCQRG